MPAKCPAFYKIESNIKFEIYFRSRAFDFDWLALIQQLLELIRIRKYEIKIAHDTGFVPKTKTCDNVSQVDKSAQNAT